MAKLSHADSRRMYSWWWDSHISPKNSKWLQENLTDMDAKVKGMIKLIEEDADSFARRAEMYYKKRPELMKMVEEFYRAYRALAERYDHATGVIRHAHRTMSEAFPNQVPPIFSDDSPASFGSGTDPRTPEMTTPVGEYQDGFDSITGRKGMKPLNNPLGPVERARRGLNFDETEEKENGTHIPESNQSKEQSFSKSYEETEEIQALKEAISKLEAEKEAGRVQYNQSLDKLSQLQAEFSKMNEDYRVLNEHASKAENEVVFLKEALNTLEAEKESKLQDYQQCVEKISNLQTVITTAHEDVPKLNERATSAETEVQSLKGELNKLTVEKDAALDKYMQSLVTISNLENKLLLTEEDARRMKERAEKAESEVEFLKQTIAKLTEEKETAALQYQQCLETISILETKMLSSQEEAKRLSVEVDDGATKLKGAEEQCLLLERSNQSLHSELESLMLKMGTQTQELTEKQKELGRLWACLQEERLRFVEAETAFQTLQHLHAQTQEELRSVASELQNSAQVLKVMETQNISFQDEVFKVKQENEHLNEINASSTLSIKDLQNEISCLMESKGKLQEEVELRVDQRNALQQEIYCLKEELNDLNKKHHGILDQVHAVGLNPESLESSVKELQDDNSRLKDVCQRESTEKVDLLVKLEQLVEKNSLLEASLSDLNAELEAVRGKLQALEQSCQSLLTEKSTLLDEKASLLLQLHETKMNLEKVSENNIVLESSIADAHHQLETLKAKLKTLEDSCQLLASEKAGLVSANDGLSSQLESTNLRLDDLGKLYGELEGRCTTLEKENESNHSKIEELQISLGVERQEHVNYVRMSETQLGDAETEISHLKEECQQRKRELDQVLDNAIINEIELFVLRTIAKEMKEYNCFMIMKNQKLLEESEKKILQLEENNFEQQKEIKSLSGQTGRLRAGTGKLLKILNIFHDHRLEDRLEQDEVYYNQLFSKLQDMQNSLHKAEAENLESNVEVSILIAWLRELNLDLQNLKVDKNKVDHDLRGKTEQALVLLNQVLALHEVNEELQSKLREGDCNKEVLETQIEGLNRKLLDLQATFQELEREKSEIFEEKGSLMENILQLEEKNRSLEEENHLLCNKVLDLENLSLIFRSFADEKLMVLRDLENDQDKLQSMNAALMGKLSLTEGSLEESKIENGDLKEKLLKTEDELKVIATANDQLATEIENGKKLVTEMALELHMAEEKVGLLSESVEDMRITCNEANSIRDEQENQIIKLLADNEHLSRDGNVLRGECQKLEIELQELKIELDNRRIQEEKFHLELQKQLNVIENGKKLVAKMALELQTAEEKIRLVEIEKIVLSESVKDMRIKCTEANSACNEQQNLILKLSADNEHLGRDGNALGEVCQKLEVELQELRNEHDKRRIQVESLHLEMQKKQNEIDELESQAVSVFGQLQYSTVSHLLHEQKLHELHEEGLGYMDQNEDLKTQLAAFGPEIVSLKECISSLENQTDIHIKFQNPENEVADITNKAGDSVALIQEKAALQPSMLSDMHCLRVRLQVITKAAAEMKELLVQENTTLHAKLDASMRKLELLQSESGRHKRNMRTTSEITEADNVLLTKDIVLDQASANSSFRFSKREPVDADNQIVELCETGDPDGTVCLTVSKSKKVSSPSSSATKADARHVNSMKKPKGGFPTSDSLIEEDFSVDNLEISKRFTDHHLDGNKRKVLERLDSDVQKLANLQITVQDLKRKLEVTEKGKRGKAVIECEALKGQLEEADTAIVKLFDLNSRLMKNIDKRSFSGTKSSSFDQEEDGGSQRTKISEQARRISEKIGRLQLEVQKLQFMLLKLDDEKEGKSRMAEAKRRILLRDYLYGGGRNGNRRKRGHLCSCVQPKTIED